MSKAVPGLGIKAVVRESDRKPGLVLNYLTRELKITATASYYTSPWCSCPEFH